MCMKKGLLKKKFFNCSKLFYVTQLKVEAYRNKL